ncbi:MAG TPA: phage tail protein [Acidimicrobiales bacterium]|nr:phage tail protein [Acidimicrobiales bacterium]
MPLPSLRRILNSTPGSATDIDYNDQVVEQYVNTEVISRDGSVAMTAPLVGVPAVNSNEYVTLAQVNDSGGGVATVPTGTIVDFGGVTAPFGWALCNGGVQSSTDPTYAPLHSVIGTRFGDAGAGNFNLPDFRSRVAVGVNAANPATDTVGETGGSADAIVATHTHTATMSGTASTNTHKHTSFVRGNFGTFSSDTSGTLVTTPPIQNLPEGTGFDSHSHTISGSVTVTGAGESPTNKNYPPFVVVTKIIKL